MASARPLVAVRSLDKDAKTVSVPTPAVFTAPIRPDIVHFVHTNMNKNKRQAYGVNDMSGMQHSAESWGTGRAVARIPRVSGGGTSRSGQAAFGNMCRKGRMFAPTKVWRKWHRKINTNQKRYAVVSALAASALPSLVMARGHRVENVPEIPLVVDNSLESIEKTKAAVVALQAFGAYEDVEKAAASRKLRCGVGKSRNRRHVQRRGPLVVFAQDQGLTRAFRNLPGVETASVDSLNLLQLAPGGHLGRFIVWTRGAFEKLHSIYGSVNRESAQKAGFKLPRSVMHNSDLTRIINSDEIQSKLRPSIKTVHRFRQHKNPLKNLGVMVRLNPYAATARRSEILAQQRRAEAKNAVLAKAKAQADAVQAAKDRTHEPQQRLNFKRLFDDDFKAPEEFKLVIQKPRSPITPPAPLTADQKAKKVAARKASAKAVKPAKAAVVAEKAALTGAQEMLATLMKGQTTITKTKAKKAGGGAKGGKGAAKKGDAKKGDAKAAAPKKK